MSSVSGSSKVAMVASRVDASSGVASDSAGGHHLTQGVVLRTRALLLAVVVLFNCPMWAFLPGVIDYYVARRCADMGAAKCDSAEVSASAALWENYTFIIPCNVSNCLTALALATLSDRYGRKPLLLLCVLTQCAGSACSLAVVLFRLDLWWLVPGFAVNGLGGASWVMVVLVMASLGDTAPDNTARARLFSAAMGLYYGCSAVGPILGGELTARAGRVFDGDCAWCHGDDLQAVFVLFFVTNVLVAVLVALFFVETALPSMLERNREAAAAQAASSGWLSVLFVQPTLGPVRLVARNARLAMLTAVYSLCYLGMADRSALLTLYAKKSPFDMDDDEVGWFLSSLGAMRALAVFALLPLALRAVSLLGASRVGIAAAATLTGCIGIAHGKRELFAVATASGVDAVWDTSLRVLFSAAGAATAAGEGEVLGVIGFLQVFLGSVAPIIFQTIYAASVGWCPAFSFYLIAGLAGAGLLVSLGLRDEQYGRQGGGDEPSGRQGGAGAETEPLLSSVQAAD